MTRRRSWPPRSTRATSRPRRIWSRDAFPSDLILRSVRRARLEGWPHTLRPVAVLRDARFAGSSGRGHWVDCGYPQSVGWAKARSAGPTRSDLRPRKTWARFALPTLRLPAANFSAMSLAPHRESDTHEISQLF